MGHVRCHLGTIEAPRTTNCELLSDVTMLLLMGWTTVKTTSEQVTAVGEGRTTCTKDIQLSPDANDQLL